MRQGWTKPYLYRDVFDKFVARHISVNRTNWDNISKDREFISPTSDSGDEVKQAWEKLSDVEKHSVKSFDHCEEACHAWKDCVQWMYLDDGVCKLGKDIRLGEADARDGHKWSSGWKQDRIKKMRDDLANCKIRWDGE